MAETVEENKVKIEIPQGLKHAAKIKYFNPKLAMLREAVLATVQIEADKLVKPLQCLDAFSGSGLTGLQWKLHLGNKVHVVLSEGTHIKESCELNEMKHSDWLLDATRTTGEWPSAEQSEQEVHVCPFKASIVLHGEAFNFVFLQRLFKNIAQYTDSVFSNLRQNGVACFLTPNISSACFRSPQIIERLYGAHTQKTEYIDELAVRVFIADLAKAAARYQKGITVLYTISDEDHFLVVVRVTKNNQSSISSVENCRPFLHCLMCEERVAFPQTNSPIENPYSLLPCECKAKHPGKTAVILGPLWVGEIFSISFIEQLLICTQDKSTDVCLKLRTLLKSLLEEARCPSENGNSVESVSLTQVKEECNNGGTGDNSEPVLKKPKLENGGKSENKTQESVTMSENVSESLCKHSEIKTEENSTEKSHAMPLFYYNIQNKKYKSLPKISTLENYNCVICGKTFATDKTLKVHIQSHEGNKIHVCAICGKGFTRKDVYNHHIKAHDTESPSYMCQVCGKFYTRKSCLDRHSISHQPEKMPECSICKKTFTTKSSLDKHFRTHEEKKECPTCKKMFIHLGDHMKQCGKDPTFYQCENCGEIFRQKRYLRQHTRCVHNNPKQYVCQTCGKRFNYRASLYHHKKNCT